MSFIFVLCIFLTLFIVFGNGTIEDGMCVGAVVPGRSRYNTDGATTVSTALDVLL